MRRQGRPAAAGNSGPPAPSLGLNEGGVGGENQPKPLGRGVSLVAGQGLLHVPVQGGKATGEQVLLGTEVVVKGAGGNARPLADIPDGNLVKAVFTGQLHGGLENGLLGLLRLLLPALAVVHGLSLLPLDTLVFSRYNSDITMLCGFCHSDYRIG